MGKTKPSSGTKKDVVKAALTRVLRPLVRMMLHYGLPHREIAEVSKHVFYEEGCRILKEQNAKISYSQLATLTGLHRKDITAFATRNETAPLKEEKKEFSTGAAIVAEWTTASPYLDKKGKPRPLPYTAEEDTTSFTSLATSLSKDVRPKAHLDALLRLGIVRMDDKNMVHLEKDAFLPSEDFSERVGMFSRTAGDHIAAASANIASDTPPHFDRVAFHAELTDEDIASLRTMVDAQGMDLIKKVYRQADELSRKDASSKNKKNRMSFGIYYFHEKEDDKI